MSADGSWLTWSPKEIDWYEFMKTAKIRLYDERGPVADFDMSDQKTGNIVITLCPVDKTPEKE
jgi:hypothetical protein